MDFFFFDSEDKNIETFTIEDGYEEKYDDNDTEDRMEKMLSAITIHEECTDEEGVYLQEKVKDAFQKYGVIKTCQSILRYKYPRERFIWQNLYPIGTCEMEVNDSIWYFFYLYKWVQDYEIDDSTVFFFFDAICKQEWIFREVEMDDFWHTIPFIYLTTEDSFYPSIEWYYKDNESNIYVFNEKYEKEGYFPHEKFTNYLIHKITAGKHERCRYSDINQLLITSNEWDIMEAYTDRFISFRKYPDIIQYIVSYMDCLGYEIFLTKMNGIKMVFVKENFPLEDCHWFQPFSINISANKTFLKRKLEFLPME